MESREGAMLEAAAALLSARHAIPTSGTSTMLSATSLRGSVAPAAAWPSGSGSEHTFGHERGQRREGTPSHPLQPIEAMMQWTYPVGYMCEEASAEQRSSGVNGMSQQAPHEIGQPQVVSQHEQQRQELIHQRLQEKQQLLQQQSMQQQQQLQQQRLYQQQQHLHQQQRQQQHELRHQQRTEHQNISSREPLPQHQDHQPQQSRLSQQPQPFQASRASQASQQPHLASRQAQQPPPQQQQRQRQPKKQQILKHKRKNESNQRREIDDILALAEPQPEFARPQYRAQFEQANVLSQDEAQARRSASAVIRPGQSIVPQTYQRRPVETNLRLRAMSRMTGSSMGDGSQNARPLPAARTMALSDVIAAAASSGVTQRLPAPAFSSTTEQSKLTGGVWPQQHQASSHRRQQPLQHVRIEGLRTPQETLFRTLQSPHTQQQQQVASQPGRRILPDLDRFIHQGFHRQTSEQPNVKRNPDIPKDLRAQGQDEWSQTILPSHSTQMQGHVSRMQPSPAVQLDRGHSLSNQHYYMAPPHQPLRLEPRFQDSMWKYPERSSAAANQVDSNLQGNVQLTARAFVAETAPYSASANANSLLPSLDIWSDKDSNWYYPSAASKKKTNALQKIKISAGHTVNLSQLAVQNDLKQLDKGVVGSQSLGSTGTLISGMGVAHKRPTGGYTTEAPSAGPSDGMPPPDGDETKLTGSRVLALPGKAMSNNRLRRMVKQNRRLQRQEMAKKEREKQVDAVQMAPQQSIPVERPRAQLQQGPKQPRLSQTSRRADIYMARPQQQMQDERVREVDFAMRSKIVSATSSSQSTATPRHADFRDYLAPKTALQREQEELLRRAQLVMAAQQQLHQRNHRDAFPYARPFPTVVARSATVSSGPPAHKRSRGEFEQQNAGVYDSTPDICLPPQSSSHHKNNGTNETSCQADDSTISEPEKYVMGRRKDMKTSEVCSTHSNERADVNQISAPSNADSACAPVDSLSCDVPATDVVKANRVPRSERPTKTRKRKASSLLHAATLAATAGVATADSAPGTGVVVPLSDSCRPETETVMIFCKRDFMRFQSGLLWKKYQEIKRKRDQTLATVTGRRARYLNARYKSSNEEDGTVELGRPRKRGLKRASRSSTLEGVGNDPAPAQEVEVLDNEDGASSGIGIGLGSHRSGDSKQVNPSETDAMDSLQDESGNPESCGATFREATACGEEGHARFIVAPSDAREHRRFLGDDDRTDPSGEDVRATSDETLPAQSEGDERKAPAAAAIEPREGCGPNDAQMLVMSIDASPSLPLEERRVLIASTVDTDCCQEADLQQETVPAQVPGDDGSPAMATSPPRGSIRDTRSVEDKASGGGNLEYVIIEEDTFGDWGCVGTHVSPATPDTTKRSPLPSPESNTGDCLPPEPAVADSGGERFLAHESQAETSTMETNRRTAADVPVSLAFQMATVTAVTTTFPIMTMPVTIPVFPHEMPRGSDSKTNDNTADNEGAGIVFREECLI